VKNLKQLYSATQISQRIDALANEISDDFKDLERPVVIGVLKGAIFFLSDLVRRMKTADSLQIEFVHLSSYGSARESTGRIQTPYLDLPNISHRHILIVEDIVDSGRTSRFFIDYLNDQFAPASIRLASFLDKPSGRVLDVHPDYTGFTIDKVFVVGYGLDYGGESGDCFRELPYLATLNLEIE
jgi:hypoxanthine phosphoribosyltransferase